METKVIHAVTVSESLGFMDGQLRYLRKQGFEPKAMTADGPGFEAFAQSEQVEMLALEMERGISPLKDLRSLSRCISILRKERPQIVNASTPKAGLIVTLAARICRVPVRIYTLRGLRLETTRGRQRQLLLQMEKLAAASATHCLAVSDSLRERAVELGIADEAKIKVLGKGSGDGFNLAKFEKTLAVERESGKVRERFGFTEQHLILGFVGRLTKDKGVNELVKTFLRLSESRQGLRLLLVGDYEEDDPLETAVRQEIENNPHIVKTGFLPDPVPYYHAMDMFVFLTKREGFGNVSIEAALCGLPIVASNVTGAKNTIINRQTGYLAEPENLEDIEDKIQKLIESAALRARFGEAGKEWASAHFSNEELWKELDNYYKDCLAGTFVPASEMS